MSNLNQFIGSARGFPFGSGVIRFITQSETFTVPPGVYKLRAWVLGGGGSGAAVSGTSTLRTTGGAGGGLAMKIMDVTPGQAISAVVGAGGAGATATNGAANGNNGGNSSFGSLTANGGGGGKHTTGIGGVGGTATGGDYNFTGGDGGGISVAVTSGAATGGGSAPSLRGDGKRGGNVSYIESAHVATGGGGCGGRGGDYAAAGLNVTAGGGSTGAATDASGSGSLPGPGFNGMRQINQYLTTPCPIPFLSPDASGGSTSYPLSSSGGGGSGIRATYGYAAPLLGGTGGNVYNGAALITSPTAVLGAGSGGCQCSDITFSATSGSGGNGIIIVEY